MTVQPLLCVVCERPCHSLTEWVTSGDHRPIYGLHNTCATRISEGAITLQWSARGEPIVTRPTNYVWPKDDDVEERLLRTEIRLDNLEYKLGRKFPTEPWSAP